MKVLFMGTPDFAVASLCALISSKHEVVGVVTQPDRALKRGKVECSAVKTAAQDAGLTVFQPLKIRDEIDALKAFGADIAVTAAYGQILTQAVLDAFPRGVINVHASLLPEYRGASPIQSAIADGKSVTGVTVMRTELGIDTGDILATRGLEIGEEETATQLSARLCELGAELLVETLDNFDRIVPTAQDDAKATHCRMIKKSEQFIDFDRSAKDVVNRIRALADNPCAKTVICGDVYKIYGARVTDGRPAKCGEIIECGDRLVIACADGAVEVTEIQASGKRRLAVAEFLRGKKFPTGAICAKE